MERFKIRNMDDFTIREMKLTQSVDPMRVFLEKVKIEKDNLIVKEMLIILSRYYKEFESSSIEDYTIHDLIEFIKDEDIILEIEEPEMNLCESVQDPISVEYTIRWALTSPKVKLYKRML